MADPTPQAERGRVCPNCGEPLHSDGALLRCDAHGQFFRYGPRLLVHVAHEAGSRPALLPWQTLADRATS